MNELPRADALDNEFVERAPQRARRIGVEALERELHGETTDAVDIAIHVNGRMIATATDSATVARILAILTGLGG